MIVIDQGLYSLVCDFVNNDERIIQAKRKYVIENLRKLDEYKFEPQLSDEEIELRTYAEDREDSASYAYAYALETEFDTQLLLQAALNFVHHPARSREYLTYVA